MKYESYEIFNHMRMKKWGFISVEVTEYVLRDGVIGLGRDISSRHGENGGIV